MKINPLEVVLCRVPAFGITDELENRWTNLKQKIKESSLAFYQTIAHLDAKDINQLPEKARFTLWKYFNRAKFRSTPFGSFASVVPIPLASTLNIPIEISETIYAHHFIDWSHKEIHTQNLKRTFKRSQFFLSNSSIYYVGQEIRYICFKNQEFELAAVARIPELEVLLNYCTQQVQLDSIQELMLEAFEMDAGNTNQLLIQLIELQLLNTDAFPNITGEDYFKRIDYQTEKQASDYIISERQLLKGSFNQQYLKQLPELINFLQQNVPAPVNYDLLDFKQAFLKKFEQKEVSLAIAMDPEVGIGYGKLEQQRQQDKLITDIKEARKNQKNTAQVDYGPLQHFLLNQMMQGERIDLANFQNNACTNDAQLPNTFNVIFHLFKGHPVVNQIGGCTANALLGRFTLANPQIEAYGKTIAQIEKEANPDVLFFDIAYQAEQRVDNVNRRKMLYDLELPILTWPATTQSLDFNDILVSICGQEIVLRSKKLNKRLIPRIPSAYNYSRSDLSAYRFLCDLQHQNLHGNLSFKLQDYFPHLSYYPRVHFKDIIVSPATWLVPQQVFKEKQANDVLSLLKSWLNEKQIHTSFKAGHADHILCFDPTKDEDLNAFVLYGKQCCGKEIYISEGLIAISDCISDEKGSKHLPQFIVSYSHKEAIYRPYANIGSAHLNKPQQPLLELPGGDWIYFELYLHPSRSNAILKHFIQPFLKENQPKIKKWFFIRYNEPSAHLRFRIHLNDKSEGFQLMDSFRRLIVNEVQLGLIQDFKIRTYYKETERYGAMRMDLVERFFCADSQYALSLVAKTSNSEELYLATLPLLMELCELAMPSISEQLSFAKEIAYNFAQEMTIDVDNFKRINSEFNGIKKKIDQHRFLVPKSVLQPLLKHFQLLMSSCENEASKKKLFTDLIHMHVNRLFIADQRVHETIIYHYLMRALQTKRALLALPVE